MPETNEPLTEEEKIVRAEMGKLVEEQEELSTAKRKKPKKPRDKTFGCPDWVEDVVIPIGERAAKLWRHLKATHRVGGPAQNMRTLKLDWDRFFPHVKDWK